MTDTLDVAAIKKDFPILEREVHGGRLVYLDSANTSQKPRVVLDAMARYYERSNANVHRGTYLIAEEATAALEEARAKVARFIGAGHPREVVFTKNATEALNLVAKAWGRANLSEGDVVVLTELEHHANIVPWHQLHDELGVELRWIPVRSDGHLDLTDLDRLVDGAKVVSFAAMSNVLGTLLPVERLVTAAHDAGAIAVVDASQHVPHVTTDVRGWGADFVAFTGHKMCGPTGIGVLWGTSEILDATPPFLTGGEMILNVTKEGFTANELPWKFEAGTPPIAEAVGLGTAVDYLTGLGMEAVREHEVALTALRPAVAHRAVRQRPGDPRPLRPGGAGWRALLQRRRPAPARPHPGVRRARRVRARRPPLRQAAHARARRRRHRAGLPVRLQRRSRRRRAGRCHRRRRRVLRPMTARIPARRRGATDR